MMANAAKATGLDTLASLRKSDRMPVLFLGHGSPMNAIQDNEYRRSWQSLGAEFGKTRPQPQLILCISAHWLTRGWWLTAMDRPKTIHDFGGFPQELFDQQCPAPGAPKVAQATRRGVPSTQAYDWAIEFDSKVATQLEKGDLAALADFQKMGQVAQLAHPTHDHYLPLLYAAGAVDSGEPLRFFNSSYQSASISMRSAIWS